MLKKQQFDQILKNVVVFNNQGYALYFKYDDLEIKKTNGFTHDNQGTVITYDTCFRLASVSKQFIAFAIITLVEKEKLSYETTIDQIYEDLPYYFKTITIRNLLNHTSGIYDYEKIPHQENDEQIKDYQIFGFLKGTDTTYFKPGTKYQYSNTGYILLGLIIEKVSHMKIDQYLEENVFKKAKLSNTYVNYEGQTDIPNRAYGHLLEYNQLIVKDQYWCSATIGDGGIYSSINDLNTWLDYLLDECYDRLKNSMFQPNMLSDNINTEYGLGMRIANLNGNHIYYHCGDTIGTNTLILFSKELNLRCIFLTNMGNIDTNVLKENIFNFISNKKE